MIIANKQSFCLRTLLPLITDNLVSTHPKIDSPLVKVMFDSEI
jgi:hypothetical protein